MEKICPLCRYPILKHFNLHVSKCNGSRPALRRYRDKYNNFKEYVDSRVGKELPSKTKEKISIALRGRKPTKEAIENWRISAKRNGKMGGPRRGGGRGKSGWYMGYWCDSSWELAFVVYNIENKIQFKRNNRGFDYVYSGITFKFYPDFVMGSGEFVEIKGYRNEKTEAKIKSFKEKLRLIEKEEVKPYLEYAINKYGKNFVKLYENGEVA